MSKIQELSPEAHENIKEIVKEQQAAERRTRIAIRSTLTALGYDPETHTIQVQNEGSIVFQPQSD